MLVRYDGNALAVSNYYKNQYPNCRYSDKIEYTCTE